MDGGHRGGGEPARMYKRSRDREEEVRRQGEGRAEMETRIAST